MKIDTGIELPDYMLIIRYIRTKEKKNINTMTKELNMTYSHVHKIIHLMELKGWVKTIKENRILVITLTEIGIVFADNIIKTLDCIGLTEEILIDLSNQRNKWTNKKEEVVSNGTDDKGA